MTVTEVNQLVQPLRAGGEDDEDGRQGRHAADPRHGPDPRRGGYGGGKQQPQGKKKSGSQSGNPAKRAAENAALASGATPAGQGRRRGSGFGLGAGSGRQGRPDRGRTRRAAEVPRALTASLTACGRPLSCAQYSE